MNGFSRNDQNSWMESFDRRLTSVENSLRDFETNQILKSSSLNSIIPGKTSMLPSPPGFTKNQIDQILSSDSCNSQNQTIIMDLPWAKQENSLINDIEKWTSTSQKHPQLRNQPARQCDSSYTNEKKSWKMETRNSHSTPSIKRNSQSQFKITKKREESLVQEAPKIVTSFGGLVIEEDEQDIDWTSQSYHSKFA
jgi:hypothetical protein